MGSLNVNGMRDGRKNRLLSEIIHIKDIGVILLQETHSDQSNEAEWGLWWEGEHILSHGSNFSAGVAVLFSPNVKVKILAKHEVEPGRLLIVRA